MTKKINCHENQDDHQLMINHQTLTKCSVPTFCTTWVSNIIELKHVATFCY